MAAPRRRARELALQALYEMEVGGHPPRPTLERLIQESRVGDELAEFSRVLLNGVLDNRQEIDGIIERTAPAWPAAQMAPVDKNILRIAIREFL